MLKYILYIIGTVLLFQSCSQTENTSEHSEHEHMHDTTKAKEEYVCPMFCDSTVHDKPGVCKVCGMDFEKVKKEKKVYTCPMHPEIIRDQPGQCPVCGMDLVEKMESSNRPANSALYDVVKPVNETVLAFVKTIKPEKKDLPLIVDAMGYIAYNPKNTKSISVRYSGRIEKLYIKYNYQPIKKGQKIMEIYSPDLITAQQNYLFFLLNYSNATELVQAAKRKLQLLGMEEQQLSVLTRTHKVENTMSVYSPYEGHIHEMNNLTEVSMPTMEMTGNADRNDAAVQKEFSIREGMYVQKGQTIFDVISSTNPWAILKIYPEYIKEIKLNQPVEIQVESAPHTHYQDKIDYIEPAFEKDSRYLHVRVYLDNSDHHTLKIGTLIKAKINTGVHSGLWIPRQAVLDLGNESFAVFLKKGNAFYVKNIKAGERVGTLIRIEGLTALDEIAEDAQYLVDSEGFIKVQ